MHFENASAAVASCASQPFQCVQCSMLCLGHLGHYDRCTKQARAEVKQMGTLGLRCTSLEGDGGHPFAIAGEWVNLYNLVTLLQGPHLHPQFAAQLQQGTLCAVTHPHKVVCMHTAP